MQGDSSQNRKDMHYNQKEFYNNSPLKNNILSELTYDITNTEVLDVNVEKFLVEIADNYIDNILSSACQIAKHKKSDYLGIPELALAMDKNFEIFEPTRATQTFNRLKSNEIKSLSTPDHKRRVELTREETKNINLEK